jgi:DNA polymerase-3 subunit delta'
MAAATKAEKDISTPAAAALPWLERGLAKTAVELPPAAIVRGRDGDGAALFALALVRRRLLQGGDEARAEAMLAAGGHPDFIRVLPIIRPTKIKPKDAIPCDGFFSTDDGKDDGATTKSVRKIIRIGQIRHLNEACALSPKFAEVKIALILRAAEMNRNAANALLKTLEEPPPSARLLLVCERPRLLPPTIASRCRIIPAPAPAPGEARQWLSQCGVADADALLSLCGDAPLSALEAAQTANSARAAMLAFFVRGGGAIEAAFALQKSPPALWLDWLQKWIADLAAATQGLPPRFYPGEAAEINRAAGRIAAINKTGGAYPVVFDFAANLAQARRAAAHPQNARLLLEATLYQYRAMFSPRS